MYILFFEVHKCPYCGSKIAKILEDTDRIKSNCCQCNGMLLTLGEEGFVKISNKLGEFLEKCL